MIMEIFKPLENACTPPAKAGQHDGVRLSLLASWKRESLRRGGRLENILLALSLLINGIHLPAVLRILYF